MRNSLRGIAITAASVLLGCMLFAVPASAKSLDWKRWDADITINKDGTFTVRETYEIQFIGGDFTFGYRKIPINKFASIKNVSVTSGGLNYEESSSNSADTFEWGQDDDQYIVNWYYPATSDSSMVFVVQYDVVDGIAIDDKGSDRFFWKAVGPDHDFAVDSSTVSITAPPGAAFDTSVAPAVFGGENMRYNFSADKRTVTITGQDIATSEAFEVGIDFPHGYIPNEKPAWQTVEQQKSIMDMFFGVAALLIIVGGLLGVFMLWSMAGRDPDPGIVPEYLTEPPSDLPPGLVGTLVDEKADLQDIIATLVDLARRGAIDMEEESHKSFGIISSSDFIFHKRPDFDGSLRKYEKLLISEVFGSKTKVALSDLKNEFYSSIPKLQSALYDESVSEGLFPANPKSVRSRYLVLGVVGLVVAVGSFFCTVPFLGDIANAFLCPFIALGIASLALMGVSGSMAAKSRKGAEEAAKWKAFKEYLLRTEKYVDLKSVTDQFDRFLPYTIAFGLDRNWISKFSRVSDAPVPGWYYPSVIPYHGGVGRSGGIGQSVLGGGASGGGIQDLSGSAAGSGPSLDKASGQMFSGLNSMSGGLFAMLNSTASTFTSVPQSSSSGYSGGGFSGGGFSGGGGGGGGGAGFG